MSETKKPIILIAEDDDDDFLLVQDAFSEVGIQCDLQRVCDGDELMNTLLLKVKNQKTPELPNLILLDLNMHKKDGRVALKEIRSQEGLHHIPIIIFTTSNADTDINNAYQLGANSYIRKPESFEKLLETFKVFKQYWLEIVKLPKR